MQRNLCLKRPSSRIGSYPTEEAYFCPCTCEFFAQKHCDSLLAGFLLSGIGLGGRAHGTCS
jgi:hypothetical protein